MKKGCSMGKYMKFFRSFLVLMIGVLFLVGCGGSEETTADITTPVVTTTPSNGEGNTTDSNSTQKTTVSGYVVDDPIEGAEVYIDFGDGNISTKAITGSDGSYELKLSDEDLAKINPVIPEGSDGPKDDLIIVAEKDKKILRNAIDRDVENGKTVYITNDTEAYAQYLETIGEFTASTLTLFNSEIEKGRIKDSSDLSGFIKDIREDVKLYFYGGDKPTASSLFEKAFTHLGEEKLSEMSDHSSYVAHREVMSGGDIILPSNVTVESDDITLTSKGNGRFTVGDGSDGDLIVYLKVVDSDIYRLIPLSIKEKQVTLLSSDVVTPQKGKDIGTDQDSISVTIPPYALLTNKTISFHKIESQGETADGKMILDMQPSGLKFDLPITVKVKYSDFGVTDPEAVEWKYGSVDGGYEDADIVNIDKDSGLIYLNITHFSNLVVREIKSQKYLDLKEKFIVHIPRRNHNLRPSKYNKTLIEEKDVIISNKLFNGSSLSNLNTDGNVAGGQCVQYAKYLHYPIKYGVVGIYRTFANSSQAKNIATQIKNDIFQTTKTKIKTKAEKEEYLNDKGIRKSTSECEVDDILLMNFNTAVGHIAVLEEEIDDVSKISLINSNWFPFTNFTSKGNKSLYTIKDKPQYRYPRDGTSSHERFGIDTVNIGYTYKSKKTEKEVSVGARYAIQESTDNYSLSLRKNTFLCLANPDINNDGVYDAKNGDEDASDYISFIASNTKKKISYRTVFDKEKVSAGNKYNTGNYDVTNTPWMYYLLDTEGNGVSITKETSGAKYYGYEPDILPVAPLKFDSNYQLTSDVESRYEIYVSDSFSDTDEFRLTGFSNVKKDELDTEDNIIVTDDSLSFNGNTLKKLKQKDNNKTEFKLVPENGVENFESRYELRTSTTDNSVDTKKKVLFSPNVIDDYYVNWSKDNKYDTSKILIGFWNSYGYDIPLADNDGVVTEKLDPKKIYKSYSAVNGYFMTLANGDKAEWHFSLAGNHAIFVHVPTGKYSDIEKAKYEYKNIKGDIYTLKAKTIPQKLNDSGFENWFVLYKVKKNGENIDDKEKKYSFELGGSESLKVTADGGAVVVDAIRLQGRESLVEDLTARGIVTVSDEDDINDVAINVIVKDENGKEVSNIKTKASNIENVNVTVPKTSNSKFFYFFYIPLSPLFYDTAQNKQEKSLNKLEDTTKKVMGGSSSSSQINNDERYYKTQKVANNTSFLAYSPTKLTIKVKEDDTEITLPKVVLQKNTFVDTFTFHVKDGSTTALSGVNIDIKYGIDNDSELIAYSGTTDSSGKFEINQLAYGQYTAILSLAGYAPRIVNFTVSDTQTSIDEKMVVAQGSTLEGTWIADSNYVPNVSQASYKNSISIEKDGNNYKGTYKSIYSFYPDEYCGLLTSTSEADFTAIINGDYLDLTFTSDSGDIETECDGSWVNAQAFSNGMTLRLELNSNDSGILSLKYDTCGWSQNGICEQGMPLFYKFGDTNPIYPNLNAELGNKIKGSEYTEYKFNLLNVDDFSEDMFKDGRTWLTIFDQNNNFIYGFSTITDSNFDKLKKKNFWWFSIPNNNISITGVKIKLHDKKDDIYYSSELLPL